MKPGPEMAVVFTDVGWVSRIYNTHRVQFSQSNLQKGLVLLKNILKKFKWILTMSNFENLKTASYLLSILTNQVFF